ncbi:MAG: hypothetical protein QM726_23685 [Chitinophagaceae bacterium]
MESNSEQSILDEFVTKPKKVLFSKIATICAGLSLLLLGALIIVSEFMRAKTPSANRLLFQFVLVGMYLSMLIGIICTIIGLVKREKLKYFKLIGSIINILFFIIFFVIMAISLIMD